VERIDQARVLASAERPVITQPQTMRRIDSPGISRQARAPGAVALRLPATWYTAVR
jgi:hypothetical protein